MKSIALRLILLYQKFFSPDHSQIGKKKHPYGYCRYYPTCSEYGYMAIQKKGFFRGSLLVVWRILRCNPWSKGGIDFPF